MSSLSRKKLLIAGGGTGGHVLAGIAVADLWKEQGGEVLFVGAQGGLEEKLVPKQGYPLKLLRLGALNRAGLKKQIQTMLQLPLAFLHSGWILLTYRPQFVLGVGGYASGPAVLIAKIFGVFRLVRVRVGILEQNSIPGMTNRILGRFADGIFSAFPQLEKYFPGKNVKFTGNPIRSALKPMPAAPRKPFKIFIFGGSRGAVGVNTLVLSALGHLTDIQDQIELIHQTGEGDFKRVEEGYRQAKFPARIEKFIFDMPSVYAESSLLICRAGSSTLAEVSAVGRCAILVPLPTAADNHQEQNARVFTEEGAARLLLQQQASGGDLARMIRELMTNPDLISQMETKVVQFFRPHAARDVVNGLIELSAEPLQVKPM